MARKFIDGDTTFDDYDDEREEKILRKKKKTRNDFVRNSNSPRLRDMRKSWDDENEND